MNSLLKNIIGSLLIVLFFGCKSTPITHYKNLKVKFLSEYILPDTITVANTRVGGLSGIDYYKGMYYLVCDDSNNPRFYEATISIDSFKISSINFNKVVEIQDKSDFLDLESIRFNIASNQVLLTSEGHIKNKKDPMFFSANLDGEVKTRFKIPDEFKANSLEKPRHNGTLEALCYSFDKNGYWIGMELPLMADGLEPQLTPTKSPVRITYINSKTKRPEKQFAYFLDPIVKKPIGNFSVNGLTDMLEYKDNIFLTIERSYSSGLGNQGNTIKLFKVDASKATNTLNMNSLSNADYVAAKKELLFNFEDVRSQLTNQSIDNIEGITFGPRLPNGHQSLLLISDNNFNTMGKQLNQFILLELIDD